MPGKKRARPAAAAAADAAAPAADDGEADFPRGGGGQDELTPLERRGLALQAEQDFRQEQQAGAAEGGSKSRKKGRLSGAQDEEGAFFARAAARGGKETPLVQQLRAKALTPGLCLWACVLEVSDEQLTLSLPYGLRATVPASETSDFLHHVLDASSKRGAKLRAQLPGGVAPRLSQLFSVGQFVRCIVRDNSSGGSSSGGAEPGATAGKQRRVTATLRLKPLRAGLGASEAAGALAQGQVVPAVVQSIEDRGYSLSFGIKGVTGFLPSRDYLTHYGPASPALLPGTLLDVIVTRPPEPDAASPVVQVSVAHDAVAGAALHAWEGLTLARLLPGSLVTARVRQVARGGLLVSFGGFFTGSIEATHLPGAPLPESEWAKRFTVGAKLPARLLYVDPTAKALGLSCLPHLLNLRLPAAVPRMGQVFDAATIQAVEPQHGLLLSLPMEPQPAAGFAHISNLADSQLSAGEVAKRFKVGESVTARVIGFRLMDALVALSLKPSVLEQQVYSVKDLHPGQVLSVTVLEQVASGLSVAITPHLRGVVPRLHMTDAPGADAGKAAAKLKPGKRVDARVLSIDAARKHVQLTLKRGLVGSKLPVLADRSAAAPGAKAHGVVTGIKPYGVFVGFYAGLSGLMPKDQLGLLPGQAPSDAYSEGQLLRVEVVSVDERRARLYVRPATKKAAAADDAAPGTPGGAAAAGAWGGLAVGSVLPGPALVQNVVARPESEGGGLVELLLAGANGQSVVAHLPFAHLSDNPGGAEALMAALKPGASLPGPLLVLQQRRISPAAQPDALSRWQGGKQRGGAANGTAASDDAADEEGEDEDEEEESSEDADQPEPEPEPEQQQERVPVLLVTRKQGMLAAAAAGTLPLSTAEVAAGAVLPGYIASITRDAVFVRFLDRCTGRAGLPALADTFVTDPARHFSLGQSVMAAVVAREEGSGRLVLSVKPSVAGQHEGAFLAAMLSDLELAYRLIQESEQAAAEEAGHDGEESGEPAAPVDWRLFAPGAAVAAVLDNLKDYGAVMDLQAPNSQDLVGLVTPDQGGGSAALAPGERVTACVLDVAKATGIVELSVLPELTAIAAAGAGGGASKRRKRDKHKAADAAADGADGGEQQQQQQAPLPVGAEVQGVVQLIKDHYVVLSLRQPQQQPQQQQGDAGGKGKGKKRKAAEGDAGGGAQQQQQPKQQQRFVGIGFMPRGDMNSQGAAGRETRRFTHGQVVTGRVTAEPMHDNGWRTLLELSQPLPGSAGAAKAAGGGAKAPKQQLAQGGIVTATVVAVHEWELELTIGKSSAAHLHVAELQERLTEPLVPSPLGQYKVQQSLTAAWLGHVRGLGSKRGKDTQLSVRASAIEAAKEGGEKARVPPVLSASELHPRLLVVGWVCSLSADALWLTLAPELKGRVHVLESGSEPEQLLVPLEERFALGQALQAVVLGVDPKGHSLDLSLRPDRLRLGLTEPSEAAAAAKAGLPPAWPVPGRSQGLPAAGQLVLGRLVSVSGAGVVVQLGPRLQGVAALTDLRDDSVPNALAGLAAGAYVRARVLGAPHGGDAPGSAKQPPPLVDPKGRVLLSLRPSDGGVVAGAEGWGQPAGKRGKKQRAQQQAGAPLLQVQELKPGSTVQGYVRSVSTKGLFLVLDRAHDGRIKLSQLSDGFVEDPAAAFPVGSLLSARVLSIEHTKPPAAGDAAPAEPGGGVPLPDDGVRLELSLRTGELVGLRSLDDIQEGQRSRGKIRGIERYGIFVELARSRVSGLVHTSHLPPAHAKDLARHYTLGQAVTVRVLAIDRDAGKVSLSMKPELLEASSDEEDETEQRPAAADFDDELVDALEQQQQQQARRLRGSDSDSDASGSDASGSDASGSEGGEGSEPDEEGSDSGGLSLDDLEPSSEGEDDTGSEEGSDPDAEQPGLLHPGAVAGAAAAIADGSDWGELQLQDDAPAADADGAANGIAGGELSRAARKRLKAAREAEVRAAERARLAGPGGAPESTADYEARLLAEPNSSLLWVKYMAFQLKLGELAAARAVAERALSTIAITSEQDKFNVWVALLNLEDAYGGDAAEAQLMAVFKRALQVCDPKRLYMALLGILQRSKRWQLEADVWRTAVKKFNTSCKVWLGAFESALQAAAREAAAAAGEDDDEDGSGQRSEAAATAAAAATAPRQLLERALKSLPKRKHVKALTRAALAEFRVGCPERGRSLFEGLLANAPKRTDLWNVYIDQEIKAGDAGRVRSLLERATSLALPPKRMKGLFRRWLEFERRYGGPREVEGVKQRALEYMQAHAAGG